MLRRGFSTSSRLHKHVSHIGAKPIAFPPTVTLTPAESAVSIAGPLGSTSVFLHPFVKLNLSVPNTLSIAVDDVQVKHQRAMWGTTRTLIHNAIVGMTEGYSVPLYLVGVGYRVALENDPRGGPQRLNMKLGFSHPVIIPIPPDMKAEVPSATKIVLFCTDKQRLGEFAAHIRSKRKPEPYKGKGIFIGTETIRIKAVKKK